MRQIDAEKSIYNKIETKTYGDEYKGFPPWQGQKSCNNNGDGWPEGAFSSAILARALHGERE
jgi:hypothetical protein